MKAPLGRALGIAMLCFVAQLFLSLASIIVVASIPAALTLDISVIVTVPVGAYAAFVGLYALKVAAANISGPGTFM